ncbi:MAG: RNA methyltransferase [Anaerolineae bacterium]|nr:RNA methyltransferase [Anaerolineae bacterium]
MVEITSSQNDRVKLVRALQSRARSRRKEGKLVLEGVRLLADALACGARPEFVFYLPDQVASGQPAHPLFQALEAQDVPLFAVPEAIMAEVSDTETPQGILGVLPLPQVAPPEVVTLVLVLDGIKTPGNLGSALRTAAAVGVDAVVLPPDTVDPFNPKVLRGGMGAHFRLPILQLDWPAINRRFGALPAYVAAADGDQPYYAVDWLPPALVIVGGEAQGPTSPAYDMALRSIAIPMASGTESLNAAVAAGVILYEIKRQRLLAAGKGA